MTRPHSRIPNVLSIAGSDPSGGAGIQADLKTFAALGCHGMAAVTALTAQNTLGVSAVHHPPAAFVAEQIRMVFADIAVASVKVGMLGSRETVEAVAAVLRGYAVPIVVDPVLVATSGALLGDDAVVEAMRTHLFPLATLVTPNLPEAERLWGHRLPDEAAILRAGHALRDGLGAAWLVKGGHAAGETAEDILFETDGVTRFSAPRVATRNTHGTGCTLSAAIAAGLAHGRPLRTAIGDAKRYIGEAIAGADALDVGKGPGPLDHFAHWR